MKDNLLIERKDLGLKKETVSLYCAGGSILMPDKFVGVALNNANEGDYIQVALNGIISVPTASAITVGDIVSSSCFANNNFVVSGTSI